MPTTFDRYQWAAIVLLILVVAAMRLLPHPDNVTPVGALGLFAGAFLSHRGAWLLPLAALLLSDAVTGFYALPVMAMVYLGFAASALTGRIFLARRRSLLRLVSAVVVAALVFYLLSNFAVWMVYYPQTWAGLMECYISALPFLARSLLGDALYTAVIFGACAIGHGIWQSYQQTDSGAERLQQ